MLRIIAFLVLILLSSCVPQKRFSENKYLIKEQSTPRDYKKLIVIDAGHGGKDEGASDTPCEEKVLTLKTSKLLQKHLKTLGYRVVMTRERDVFVPLNERCSIANDLECELFVSVHFNHADNKKARGLEIFYYDDKEDPSRARKSKQLAECVHSKIINSTEVSTRGIKTADYRVIKKTEMPAVLVEGGFLSHAEEKKLCNDPIYQEALAWGIARGIDDFVKGKSSSAIR